MATVVKRVSFDAAHYLPRYEGKCKDLHGHHWVVEVAITGHINPNTGMVVDFAWLKKALEAEVTRRFDHTSLNDVFDNPTAEHIAQHIFNQIKTEWIQGPDEPIQLAWVKVWETEDSYAVVGELR